jgi:iron complex transport system substrate-binding protein
VDDHSDFPEAVVAGAARIGPDQDIDVDRVVALKPDLVVTSLTIPGHERCVERLERAGLDILVLEPTALDHVPRDIRAIGHALGVADAAERLARDFEAALVPVPVAADRPHILVEWWPKPVIVPGAKSWVTQMIERAGGTNPWGEVPEKSVSLDDEAALAAGIDAIAIAWCGVPFGKYRPEVVRRRGAWRELPALREDRIYRVTEAWLGRPGPRLVEGYRALTEIVADCRGGKPAQERSYGC